MVDPQCMVLLRPTTGTCITVWHGVQFFEKLTRDPQLLRPLPGTHSTIYTRTFFAATLQPVVDAGSGVVGVERAGSAPRLPDAWAC